MLRLTVYLPTAIWQCLGVTLGALLYRVARRRRMIVRTNIERCFPELNPVQREQLIKRNFEFFAYAVLDLGRAWWATDAHLAGLMTIEGIQYIRAAQQSGRPVILLSAHYMNLEMAGRLIADQVRLSTVYRAHENEVVNYYMVRNRAARFEQIIERDDIRLLVSLLKQGKVIWYAGDQDMGRKQSLFADFFGHPAATVTALSRLAKMSDAQVIPMSFYRESETYKHRIVFEAPLENFPSDDLVRDVSVHNHCIEQAIRRQPENYLWAHRRFKTRPEGEPPWYPKKQRRRKGRAS